LLGKDTLERFLSPKPLEGDQKFSTIISDRAKELARLDRYEREPCHDGRLQSVTWIKFLLDASYSN
jgi:hypothetical protein